MTMYSKWNSIVNNINRNRHLHETEVQKLWEGIFADSFLFGYSRFAGEIDSFRNIQIGSQERTIPDIVIRDSVANKDLFVVELKQHNLEFRTGYKNQLFSYMRLLRLNVGVLICNKIYLYILDNDDQEFAVEIPFLQDNPLGKEFVELFGKNSFDKIKVQHFIQRTHEFNRHVEEIKDSLSHLSAVDVLKQYYANSYTNEEIERAFSSVHVNIVMETSQHVGNTRMTPSVRQNASLLTTNRATPSAEATRLMTSLESRIKELSSRITVHQTALYVAYKIDNHNICAIWPYSHYVEIELYIDLQDIIIQNSGAYDITNRRRGKRKSAIKVANSEGIEKAILIIKQIVNRM